MLFNGYEGWILNLQLCKLDMLDGLYWNFAFDIEVGAFSFNRVYSIQGNLGV